MNKRRTKKAIKKWYEGRPLTALEYQAVRSHQEKAKHRIRWSISFADLRKDVTG